MTVNEICERLGAAVLCGDGSDDFEGVYVGDLLSRAMSHVESGNLWITIMSNANVIAVATLTEPAAVILAEGVLMPEEVLLNAKNNDITVLSSQLSAYELCSIISKALPEREA